jgi:hypothetical protein
LAQGLLPTETQKKIVFVGKDYLTELQNVCKRHYARWAHTLLQTAAAALLWSRSHSIAPNLQYIDIDQIPDFLGGKCTRCKENNGQGMSASPERMVLSTAVFPIGRDPSLSFQQRLVPMRRLGMLEASHFTFAYPATLR